MMKVRYIVAIAFLAMGLSGCTAERKPLQIVVTNDSHSQVEADKGLGGFEARISLLDSLRRENPNTILLDAGDMFQGTPYFNLYGGRLEVEAYNMMGYNAMTLGNHEFDNGMDSLVKRVSEMNYPVVCANYDFGTTPLADLVKPYTIIEQCGWRVGVIGLGVNPKGLILQTNVAGIEYIDPIEAVNRYAGMLKNEEGCNLVIVLSHLGVFDANGSNITDDQLAERTRGVDLIFGGHTHSRFGEFGFANLDGDSVMVVQERKAGKQVYVMTVE